MGFADIIVERIASREIALTHDASVESTYDAVMNVNARGVFLCEKYVLGQMVKQPEGGSIVNVASILGLIGVPGGGAGYVASKHGKFDIFRGASDHEERELVLM